MRPDAAFSEPVVPPRRHILLRHVAEAALLAALFGAMAVCLAAGPRLAALLLQA